MRLMRFNPLAEHVPGRQMIVADTLSRNPLKFGEEPDTVQDVQAFVDLIEYTRPATDNQMERIKEAGARDASSKRWLQLYHKDSQHVWKSHSRHESSLMHVDTCQ